MVAKKKAKSQAAREKRARKKAKAVGSAKTVPLKKAVRMLDPMERLRIDIPCGLLEGMIAAYKKSDPMDIYGAKRNVEPLETLFEEWKKEKTASPK